MVTLLFGFLCGCRVFCHRTESDIFLFHCVFQEVLIDMPSLTRTYCQFGVCFAHASYRTVDLNRAHRSAA